MELKNKHDNDPHWELKRIELRLHFLRGEISAGDRLDGWTLEGQYNLYRFREVLFR